MYVWWWLNWLIGYPIDSQLEEKATINDEYLQIPRICTYVVLVVYV